MGYYVRAFTVGDARTPLRAILDWTRAHGAELVPRGDVDLDAADWRQAELLDPATARTFLVEATRDRDDANLLGEEVEEFVDELADAPDSSERQRVLDCLSAARAVVAAQLPGGRQDEALDAAITFLQFFVEDEGGMIQADEVGFFEGDDLVVAL